MSGLSGRFAPIPTSPIEGLALSLCLLARQLGERAEEVTAVRSRGVGLSSLLSEVSGLLDVLSGLTGVTNPETCTEARLVGMQKAIDLIRQERRLA